MEAGSGEEASKYCYNGGGECQAKSSSGSVHNTSSSVLKEENTKEVQTTTRVGCLHEEALIQHKLETSKRKLGDGYQAAAKRQHLIKVLDTCDLPKTCTALDEEAMIRQKLEISKRKLKEGYQAEAKKQHLIKVLDPHNLPKSCATVSQRYRKGPAVRRCY
ncbi:hypothetical protein FRX31_035435 [Thalictrum thalictroides]|uniref:Uncharacterized protein n=1 Tax=Thalictrum thalictroides TaxID=46969 RepID=A0A7J6UR03_THATH|nr:hypothetical protein FRX31_035435 [Thalictrum thalictroides]